MEKINRIKGVKCKLGENPLWNTDDNCFYWTDIDEGMIYNSNLESNRAEVIYKGDAVGGFTFEKNKTLLLFRINDISRYEIKTRKLTQILTFDPVKFHRFNDVIATPTGSVFAGYIGIKEGERGFFHISKDGNVTPIENNTTISNGFCFDR